MYPHNPLLSNFVPSVSLHNSNDPTLNLVRSVQHAQLQAQLQTQQLLAYQQLQTQTQRQVLLSQRQAQQQEAIAKYALAQQLAELQQAQQLAELQQAQQLAELQQAQQLAEEAALAQAQAQAQDHGRSTPGALRLEDLERMLTQQTLSAGPASPHPPSLPHIDISYDIEVETLTEVYLQLGALPHEARATAEFLTDSRRRYAGQDGPSTSAPLVTQPAAAHALNAPAAAEPPAPPLTSSQALELLLEAKSRHTSHLLTLGVGMDPTKQHQAMIDLMTGSPATYSAFYDQLQSLQAEVIHAENAVQLAQQRPVQATHTEPEPSPSSVRDELTAAAESLQQMQLQLAQATQSSQASTSTTHESAAPVVSENVAPAAAPAPVNIAPGKQCRVCKVKPASYLSEQCFHLTVCQSCFGELPYPNCADCGEEILEHSKVHL